MRVAVIGATGLVGATLVERLLDRDGIEVVPVIHSSGNAWRLARRNLELKVGSLADPANLDEVLAGCTHVVNCARGDDDVMILGLRNLIAACERIKAQRFVHLSSVAVYGDPPPPESSSEDAPARPAKGSYGATKLAQDEIVQKAARASLPSVILCPPNISGCHSYFLLGLLDALRQQRLVLAGDGDAPCNLVDVQNLAYAIELALQGDVTDGRRLFVTDDEPISWKQVVDALLPLLSPNVTVPSLPRDEIGRRWHAATRPPSRSVAKSLKHLVSDDIRQALRRDPNWRVVDTFARGLVARLGSKAENRIRLAVAGPVSVPKVSGEPPINLQLSAQQLRGVRHSCDRAKKELGYRPLVNFSESVETFGKWHRHVQGHDGAFAGLLRCLEQ